MGRKDGKESSIICLDQSAKPFTIVRGPASENQGQERLPLLLRKPNRQASLGNTRALVYVELLNLISVQDAYDKAVT